MDTRHNTGAGTPQESVTLLQREDTTIIAKTGSPGFFLSFFLNINAFLAILFQMRLHRFFISETPKNFALGTTYDIEDKDLIHQWSRVFRLKGGDELILLDNSGLEFSATIIELRKGSATVKITDQKTSATLPKREVTLYQSLIKKDNFEWVVEKSTELGVSKIVPLISARSEKKNINLERLRVIAKEASEQCGRGVLPIISEPQSLEIALKGISGDSIVFDSSGEPFAEFSKRLTLNAIRCFIGPEGGFEEKEIELFKKAGAEIVSLGATTLRAETASIIATAILLV